MERVNGWLPDILKSQNDVVAQRKCVLNSEIEQFESDFFEIFSDLTDLNQKAKYFLNDIISIHEPREFNKRFAYSRAVVILLQDNLKSLKLILRSDDLAVLHSAESPGSDYNFSTPSVAPSNKHSAFADSDVGFDCKIKKNSSWNHSGIKQPFVKEKINPLNIPPIHPNFQAKKVDKETNVSSPARYSVTANSVPRDLVSTKPALTKYTFDTESLDGNIVFILSPWLFFFQPSSQLPELEILQKDLNSYVEGTTYSESDLRLWVKGLKLGSTVAAKFSDDEKWYRAKIVSFFKKAEFEVFFVDYGNFEKRSVCDLYPLPSHFRRLPGVVICCSLNNVSPPNDHCTWPDSSISAMKDLSLEHSVYESFKIQPSKSSDYPLVVVDLYKIDTRKHSKYPNPLDVAHFLSKSNHLKITQNNRDALDWFTYFFHSEDKKRRLQCTAFMGTCLIYKEQNIVKDMRMCEAHHPNSLSNNFSISKNKTEVPYLHSDRQQVEDSNCKNALTSSGMGIQNGRLVAKVYDDDDDDVVDADDYCREIKSKATDCDEIKVPCDYVEAGLSPCNYKSPNSNVNVILKEAETPHSKTSTEWSYVCDKQVSPGKLDCEVLVEEDSLKLDEHGSAVASNEAEAIKLEFKERVSEMVCKRSTCFKHKPLVVTEEQIAVFISHVESPSYFWVHIGQNSLEEMDDLNSVFQENCHVVLAENCLRHLSRIHEGIPCLVYLKDETPMFYRAEILSFEESETQNIQVLLVDYGREKTFHSEECLFELSQYFVDFLPATAVLCTLEGIEPRGENWSQEALNYFSDQVSAAPSLIAYFAEHYSLGETVFGHIGNPLVIDLEAVCNDLPESFIIKLHSLGYAKAVVENHTTEMSTDHEPTEEERVKIEKSITSEENEGMTQYLRDEMSKEYLSSRNSYNVDIEDPGVATIGYKANDESRICRYFNTRGGCYRGQYCGFAHVKGSSKVVTTDWELVYLQSFEDGVPKIPCPGRWIHVQVSALVTPSNFFVVLPFGVNHNVGDVEESCPLHGFMASLNAHYNSKVFPDHDLTTFSQGEMVVARSVEFELWHRGMIRDCTDEDNYEVFLVDYGNTECLPSNRLRKIEPRFLHLPHQGIHSYLPILPIDQTWTPEAVEYFSSIVQNQTLVAFVLRGPPGKLPLLLYLCNDKENKNICSCMVESGYAVYDSKHNMEPIVDCIDESQSASNNEEVLYIPQ